MEIKWRQRGRDNKEEISLVGRGEVKREEEEEEE